MFYVFITTLETLIILENFMKKIGIIVFIIALIAGISIAGFFSVGKFTDDLMSFSNKVKGSGNITNESREVSDFKAIDVGGNFKLEIIARKDFALEIEADDNLLEHISTEVSDGILKIETTKNISPTNKILVRISAPNIESLKTSGATIADLKNINNDSLKIDASGASKFFVEGVAKNFVIEASGASKIDAGNLKTENTSIVANGASKITVFATNELKVDLSGAGKVYYSGNPKSVLKDISGAGKIAEK